MLQLMQECIRIQSPLLYSAGNWKRARGEEMTTHYSLECIELIESDLVLHIISNMIHKAVPTTYDFLFVTITTFVGLLKHI